MHIPRYVSPRAVHFPPCFRVPVYCAHKVHIPCLNPHATPALGYGVRESLPSVCSTHRSLSSAAFLQVLHQPSIATSRSGIITWRRQGTFLLADYDTLVETGNTKKIFSWVQSLRTLRHPSMQQRTKVAAHLLRENWSIMEHLFRAAADTVCHLKKRSQPCISEYSNPKRVRIPRSPKSPESELR